MKTGLFNFNDDSLDPNQLIVLLTIFTQDANRLALAYADHKGSENVESVDLVRALKVRAFYGSEFWSDPNVQERIEKTRGILSSINDKDDLLDYMTTVGTDTEETESESEQTEQEMIPCECIICYKMNIIDELWHLWNPRNRTDQILKESINKASESF